MITKSIKYLTLILFYFTLMSCGSAIKNAKTETVKIYGNCGMCEETIEAAALKKNEAEADWNKETKMASITYDSTKTNLSAILKRIALAGYDSDEFRATDESYNKLHSCCQYERPELKTVTSEVETTEDVPFEDSDTIQVNIDQINPIIETYFILKDALVATDVKKAAAAASSLNTLIEAVDMSKLDQKTHEVWMQQMKKLSEEASIIANSKKIEQQRASFITLSNSMFSLVKAYGFNNKVYYQYCPMANNGKGAYWLSKESAIKNPYYGSQMLTCGSTKETIE